MSPEQKAAGGTTTTTTEAGSLLDQVISATKQTERSRAEDLIRTLADEALKGTVTYSKNVSVTINQARSTSPSRRNSTPSCTTRTSSSWKVRGGA